MTNKKADISSGSTIKASFWYVVCNFLIQGFGIITTPIFARLLSKGQYGEFSNFTSWINILIVVTSLNLSTTINRARYDYEEDLNAYISTMAWTSIGFSAICYVLVCLSKDFFIRFLGMEMPYIHVMFIYMLVASAINLLRTKHRLYQKYKFVTLLSLCSTLLSAGVSLILVISLENKYFGRVIGYVGPLFALNIIIMIYLLGKGKCFKKEYFRYALLIALPLIPHALAGNILDSSDRIMIRNLCTPEKAALYSLGYSCATVVGVISTSLNQAWSPWLYSRMHTNKKEEIRSQTIIYVLVFIIIVLGVVLLGPEAVMILGGKKYMSVVEIIPVVMLGCVFQFFYTLYVNIEIFCKKTIMISIGTMLAAGINVLMNFLLIPVFGYKAAAYTTLFGYMVLMIFHYMTVKRMKMADLYNNRRFAFILLFTSIAMVMATILYHFTLIRYFSVIVYAGVLFYIAWKYKKVLFNLLRN